MEKIKVLVVGACRVQIGFLQSQFGQSHDLYFWHGKKTELPFAPHFVPDVILKPITHEGIDEVREAELPGTIPSITVSIPCDPSRFKDYLRSTMLQNSGKQLGLTCPASPSFEGLIGCDPGFLEAKHKIALFAGNDEPVLILGESGSGKELAAKAIHELSKRANGPFISINCSAIPPALFESELFGSQKGAFTGAVSKPGLWERAAGGTIFLDEIGELPTDLQAKLLRALENRQAIRLGGDKHYNLDARVVTATHQDLGLAIKSQHFRADFFFRISVLSVKIPPLRARLQDLGVISKSILAGRDLSPGCISKLQAHHWPGNVRELKNVLLRASILAGLKPIGPQDLVFDQI